MSRKIVDDYLEHHGVLGMKWGVRRYQNKDGTLTEAGKKRNQKEIDKQIAKRNTDLFLKGNNYAADRINDKWLDDFNEKWSKTFEGYTDWRASPDYEKYVNAYEKNYSDLMNESLRNNPKSKFTTKLGSTYTARYLEEYGNLNWATQKEWTEYDKK